MVVTTSDKPASAHRVKDEGNKSLLPEDPNDERIRIDSESSVDSGFEGLENLEPLGFDDMQRYDGATNEQTNGQEDGEEGEEEMPNVSLFSVAMMMMKKKKAGKPMPKLPAKHRTRAAQNWLKALRIVKTRGIVDPWAKFNLNELPVETAIRHRYDALAKSWKTDNVFVKIDSKPFDEGAMRECFRMKKMDKFCPDADWTKDSNNYVAKRYKKENECDRQTYFDDIRLQMDAKLWGEEFNRHNPPKKVDIFMVTVYEFPDREGSPLFHVEHFIEGNYIKYNSNSGFVDNRVSRQTPHAFSHFTFECSGHDLIVVDVQGVGDLYTDPQIHTVDGEDYGDGNLGVKGMALFFHSHSCNSICKRLGLSSFALSGSEKQEIHSHSGSATSSISQTVVRGDEVALSASPPADEMSTHLQAFFRQRMSSRQSHNSISMSEVCEDDESPRDSISEADEDIERERGDSLSRLRTESISSGAGMVAAYARGRRGTEMFDNFQVNLLGFRENLKNKKRSTCLTSEMRRTMQCYDESVLGMVHLELAKYHEVCRFTDDGTYDKDAALFHLKAAADCGVVNAIVSMAKIYCGLPHDILSEVDATDGPADDEDDAVKIGLEYMENAAYAGDRSSMVYMAKAFDTGLNLVNSDDQSFSKALFWYEEVQEADERAAEDGKEQEWGMVDPPYCILARQAEIWLMDDVQDVNKDPNRAGELYNMAAESAMACMKGKLANKYYMLAEEAYGQVEEEEE